MNEKADLLQAVLAKLDRGDAPDRKFPDPKGEYWPLCPFHADRHHGSFTVSERGYKCFACGASGGLHDLAQKVGVARLHSSQGGKDAPPPHLTLEAYATAKKLPQDFLEKLGLTTIPHYVDVPAVRMPYYDEDGEHVAVRFRRALTGKTDRFRWRSGDSPMPYGLWKLGEAKEAGYVVLVEGESDAQTLWYHGIPTLGIPGANVWQPEWSSYVDGIAVYAWKEPDNGGDQFVERVGRTLPEAQILSPPDGRKDISECHILDDDVPTLMQDLITHATPYETIRARAREKEATEAEAKAGPLLHCPDILTAFEQLCLQLGLVGEERNAKLLYLIMTSRLSNSPVSAVVKGLSSGGKSFTVQTVLRALPDSAYYALSGMSEKALAYSREPLQHRMLVIYEASGSNSEFGTYLIRTLLSEGHVRYETVDKTADGLQARLIEREGPTGLILTTTQASLHPENETRMLSLTVRDDPEQTKAIMLTLADQANGDRAPEADLEPWHALQTWLELSGLREVVVPYARELARLANPAAVRMRRDFGAVLNLIKAHAILHQKNRQSKDGLIIATLEDYRAVYELLIDLVGEAAKTTVSKAERETVEAVRALLFLQKNKPVQVVQVANHLEIDESAASRRVKVASEKGYIINLEDRRGHPAKLVLGASMPGDVQLLPHPDALEGGEGGSIPSNKRATVQPLDDSDDSDLWQGTL